MEASKRAALVTAALKWLVGTYSYRFRVIHEIKSMLRNRSHTSQNAPATSPARSRPPPNTHPFRRLHRRVYRLELQRYQFVR
jgi:hypothetical protein